MHSFVLVDLLLSKVELFLKEMFFIVPLLLLAIVESALTVTDLLQLLLIVISDLLHM